MNKPVAWMLTLPDGTHDWILDGNNCEGYIPLYTHPVKEQEFTSGHKCPSCGCNSLLKTNRSEWCVTHKCLWQADYDLELTDEEIKQIFVEESGFDVDTCPIAIMDFARAILRKAQEK